MEEGKKVELFKLFISRLNETLIIWDTLNVFCKNEVNVGPSSICKTEKDVEYKAAVLQNLFYSFTHSLFDKRGTDFKNIKKLNQGLMNTGLDQLQREIDEQYSVIKEPLKDIRNKLGFHGAKNQDNLEEGQMALSNYKLNPDKVHLILNLLILYCKKLKNYYQTNIDFYYDYNFDNLFQSTRVEIKIQKHPKFEEIQREWLNGKIKKIEYVKTYIEIKQEVNDT